MQPCLIAASIRILDKQGCQKEGKHATSTFDLLQLCLVTVHQSTGWILRLTVCHVVIMDVLRTQ